MTVFSKPAASQARVRVSKKSSTKAGLAAKDVKPSKKRPAAAVAAHTNLEDGNFEGDVAEDERPEPEDDEVECQEPEVEDEKVEVEDAEVEGEDRNQKLSAKERRAKRQTYIRGHGKVPSGVLPKKRTPFALYMAEKWQSVAKKFVHLGGSKKQQSTVSRIGQMWRALSKESKAKYEKQSQSEVQERSEAKKSCLSAARRILQASTSGTPAMARHLCAWAMGSMRS